MTPLVSTTNNGWPDSDEVAVGCEHGDDPSGDSSASTGTIIFMTSMIAVVAPTATWSPTSTKGG